MCLQQVFEVGRALGLSQLGVALYLAVDERVFARSDNIDGRLGR